MIEYFPIISFLVTTRSLVLVFPHPELQSTKELYKAQGCICRTYLKAYSSPETKRD